MATVTAPTEKKNAFGGVTPALRVSPASAASIDDSTRDLGFHVNFKFPSPHWIGPKEK